MGEKDITEKVLEDYNDVFTDIVNVLLFHGKRVVKEDCLTDTRDISQYKIENEIHEQERDVSKLWEKQDAGIENENGEKVVIAMYGLENQTKIDKEMPFRVIGYDGAKYRGQINKEKRKHFPVVTMVLYFGERHWDKNKTLYEGMIVPKYLEPYVNDYKINVYEIAYLTEEQVSMFTSDFKIVADYFVQMRKNKNYEPSQETIRHVDEVLKLMSVLTEDNRFLKVQQESRGEVKNMCEVLDRVENRGIAKGLAQGIRAMIEMAKKYGVSRENVTREIEEQYSMSEEEAKAKVQEYWN